MLWVRVGTCNIGSLGGKVSKVCVELRKRIFDVWCLPEVRWRGQGSRMLVLVWRYTLWWNGKRDGVGSVRVIMKEGLCEKMLKIRMISDGVMTVVMVFEKDVLG